MDYPFENLNPERFQLFCQSLLSQEFPDLQCFPVAQPDGGRDAVAYISGKGAKRFAAYQVKYVRRPMETDAHTWLHEVIAGEISKVRALIPKGAERYYLVTNVPGTAHLDSGSIDKANQLLSRELGLPAVCWWRDDLNRRLDRSWTLKWVYPELMSGPDFLRLIIESGITEDRDRRQLTIRAFLRNQFHLDEEVRFKQVELQNKLLELFIDVPVTLRVSGNARKRSRTFQNIAQTMPDVVASMEPDQTIDVDGNPRLNARDGRLGAASLLLAVPHGSELDRVVLEGGPGQGKSTITQYICQVHRIRLLGESSAAHQIPELHRALPIRLPIRVDLRDFATWMSKRDPFVSAESTDLPAQWAQTLEAFVAALVAHHAGATSFSTDDLLAVARISSILLVFDGLDEVADISLRREVVDELARGCQRLRENAAGLQIIVTSRPAAFANSPGMPDKQYTNLTLMSLTPELILQYADRWVTARRLDSKLRAEFNRVLKTKLDQPHLRDLARNPMQLAILLSLLLTRGASLPDKRTALYDAYMDLFFSRESEKSSVVRDHRDLLVEIHRYIAWLLHSESEKGNSRASISQERLQKVLSEYLIREGYDPNIAGQLFAGMVERVVALVSRVQGTFEFEVQPLREYFAACFLFHTAPVSTPGKERTGSRPDRFDAIVRNFYWLNVTRFYAGCYSKGELPSLVERLQELCKEDGYSFISDPRVLAATLLSDWVFTQNPRSVQQIVRLVIDGISLRRLTANVHPQRRRSRETALLLPPRAGREELLGRCFDLLDKKPPKDFVNDIVQLIQANTPSPHEHVNVWRQYLRAATSDSARLSWLEHGSQLGILSTMPIEALSAIVRYECISDGEIRVLHDARRTDFLEADDSTCDRAVHLLLNGALHPQPRTSGKVALDFLADALRPYRYAHTLREPQPIALSAIDERIWGGEKVTVESAASVRVRSENQRKCLEFWTVAQRECEHTAREWSSELGPWSRLVQSGRALWGEQPIFNLLAVLASGIRSSSERGASATVLFDSSVDLCARARYARLRTSDPKYLRATIKAAETPAERAFALLMAMTWAHFDTIVKVADVLSDTLESLDSRMWNTLFLDIKRCRRMLIVPSGRTRRASTHIRDLGTLPVRAACALALVAPEQLADEIFQEQLAHRWEEDPRILEFAQTHALAVTSGASSDWKPNLELIRECYERGQAFESFAVRRQFNKRGGFDWVSLEVATTVAKSPMSYPGFLVDVSQARIRKDVASKVIAVADIATRDAWFS